MSPPATPTKISRLDQPEATPPVSETSTPSSAGSDPFSPTPGSVRPVVFTSSNPISIRRYNNSGSFSQPLRPALYPRAKVPDPAAPQAMGGATLSREDSASSKRSYESIYYGGSPMYPTRAKHVFKQHEAAVADIMCDFGQLEICCSGDVPLEDLLARNDIPENATLLQDFRRGVKSAFSSMFSSKPSPTPIAAPRPRKLQRRSRKDSVKTPIHGGMISSPLEASMDVHPGEIRRAVTVAEGVLQYSPYESLRSYNLSQPTEEEEEKFFADLVAQINKHTVGEVEASTHTRDSYASISSTEKSVVSDGPPGDLSPEQLLVARKENSDRYGW